MSNAEFNRNLRIYVFLEATRWPVFEPLRAGSAVHIFSDSDFPISVPSIKEMKDSVGVN